MDRSERPRRLQHHRRHRLRAGAARYLLAGAVGLLLAACRSEPDLTQLTWLEGCWQSPTDDFVISECWLRDGESLQGRGKMDDRVYETAVIGPTEAGPRYIVRKTNGSTTTFTVTRASATELRVENPEHDSPKWIQYTLTGDVVQASIGDTNTPTHSWQFTRQ